MGGERERRFCGERGSRERGGEILIEGEREAVELVKGGGGTRWKKEEEKRRKEKKRKERLKINILLLLNWPDI